MFGRDRIKNVAALKRSDGLEKSINLSPYYGFAKWKCVNKSIICNERSNK